jgi:YVTN family beta-propeller protein
MKQFLSLLALLVLILVLLPARTVAQKTYVYAALTDEGNIAKIDPAINKLMQRIQVGREPVSVALNADKSRLYVSNTGDITVSIVDLKDDRVSQVLRLPVNRRGIYSGVLIRNWEGTRIYVAERSETPDTDVRVYVIDTQKELVVGQFEAGKNITALAVTGDGTKLYVTNAGSGVGVFDTQSYERVATIPAIAGFEGTLTGVACSPTANLAYASFGPANKIQIIDTQSDKQTGILDMPKYHTGLQKDIIFSPDGRYAFVINHKNVFKDIAGINVIDAAKNEVIKIFNSGEVMKGLAATEDNKIVYIASKDLKWYSLVTLEHIRSISLRTTLGGIAVVTR